MKALVEIHALQNFAPSNLNRDDTGAPKDAFFGGRRRARISSQCLKRAVREYFKSAVNQGLMDNNSLAVRTKRLKDEIISILTGRGRDREEAENKLVLALKTVKLVVKDDGKTEYLLFLGRKEIEAIADVINTHWDAIVSSGVAEEKGGKKKGKKGADACHLPDGGQNNDCQHIPDSNVFQVNP